MSLHESDALAWTRTEQEPRQARVHRGQACDRNLDYRCREGFIAQILEALDLACSLESGAAYTNLQMQQHVGGNSTTVIAVIAYLRLH